MTQATHLPSLVILGSFILGIVAYIFMAISGGIAQFVRSNAYMAILVIGVLGLQYCIRNFNETIGIIAVAGLVIAVLAEDLLRIVFVCSSPIMQEGRRRAVLSLSIILSGAICLWETILGNTLLIKIAVMDITGGPYQISGDALKAAAVIDTPFSVTVIIVMLLIRPIVHVYLNMALSYSWIGRKWGILIPVVALHIVVDAVIILTRAPGKVIAVSLFFLVVLALIHYAYINRMNWDNNPLEQG